MIGSCCRVCHDDWVILSGLSLEECKRSLMKAEGNFDLAVTDCVAKRQAVVKQLLEKEPNISKRQVVQVSLMYNKLYVPADDSCAGQCNVQTWVFCRS